MDECARKAAALFPEYRIEHVPLPFWKRLGIVQWLMLTEFEKIWMDSKVNFDNTKSKSSLGIAYRSFDDAIRDTINSMCKDNDFVKPHSV